MNKIIKLSPWINVLVLSKFSDFNYLFVFGILGFLKYKAKKKINILSRFKKIRVFGHSLSLYFTYVCILNNLFEGVLTGHSKYIELRGVGFKYKIKSNKLFLILGYSHVTIYELPKNALVNVLNNKLLKVFSINVNIINRVVYSLKKKRMYNVYKGKGIIVKGEVLISKEGKKSNAF